jgi:hypothetical protein
LPFLHRATACAPWLLWERAIPPGLSFKEKEVTNTSDAQHTQEPWHTGGANQIIVYDEHGNAICNCITFHGKHEREATRTNARRIAACVNACEGIDTGMLEGFSRKFLARYPDLALQERQLLTRQRDNLANALREAIEDSGLLLSGPTDSRVAEHGEPHWVCRARALIAEIQP